MKPNDYPELPLEPQEKPFPRCPWCGEECDTIYVSCAGQVVGCGACIDAKDAWENRYLVD